MEATPRLLSWGPFPVPRLKGHGPEQCLEPERVAWEMGTMACRDIHNGFLAIVHVLGYRTKGSESCW